MRVVCARAEEHGRAEGRDAYGTAVAQALAPPPVALEWCLPLVRPGGRAILLAGDADLEAAARVAAKVGGGRPELVGARRLGAALAARRAEGRADSASGFPRVPGMARKRPLA